MSVSATQKLDVIAMRLALLWGLPRGHRVGTVGVKTAPPNADLKVWEQAPISLALTKLGVMKPREDWLAQKALYGFMAAPPELGNTTLSIASALPEP